MPDQNQNQAPAPTSQAPTPAPTSQNQAQPPAKKSKVGLIIVIVILVVIILFGVGGYLAYRYAKNKVNNALNLSSSTSSTSSTTGSTGSTTEETGDSVDDIYNSTKDTTPTTGLGVEVNGELKTTLAEVFGGAKLSEWMDLGDGTVLTYTLKRQIVATDYAKIETAFVNKGYVKSINYTTDQDFSVSFSKAGKDISLVGTVEEQRISATIYLSS